MRPTVYLETSIVSYLKAMPSKDVVAASKQEVMRSWWEQRRDAFELRVSQFVIDEASKGDSVCASERLKSLAGIALATVTLEVLVLGDTLLRAGGASAQGEGRRVTCRGLRRKRRGVPDDPELSSHRQRRHVA